MQAPNSIDEQDRLRALQQCELLDSPSEPAFDRISRLAARIFSAPIAAVSLVDCDRQFFKSVVGLYLRETSRDVSFCSHAILSLEPMVVLDARLDPRFSSNPLVTGEPGIRFYCGAPIEAPDGSRIGAVCVIDTEARTEVSPDLLDHLRELAAQTSAEISHRQDHRKLANTSHVLMERERELERERLLRRESDIRVHLAVEAGHMGIWDWDSQRGVFNASLLMRQMFDFTGTDHPSWRHWFRRVHPADRGELLDLLRSAATKLSTFAPEFRIISLDGAIRWIAVRGRTFRTTEGCLQGAKGICWDTTERRLNEERLRRSEELFRGVSLACPAGIFLADLQGKFSYANPRVQEIWSMSRNQLLGSGWTARLHPDDVGAVLPAWLSANEAGLKFEREFRLLLPDGIRWVLGRSTVLRDSSGAPVSTVGTLDDITERKRLEQERHASQEIARRIVDSSTDSISLLDLQGRLLFVSPGKLEKLGFPHASALLGQHYSCFFRGAAELAAAATAFQGALAGRTETFQGYVPDGCGDLRWWHIVLSPIVDKDGVPERVLSVARDMTDLHRTAEEQEKARRIAEEANEAKNLFLANVSHELRTPLNGVLATADLLLNSSSLDPDHQELALTVKQSGEALLSLVNDLLDLGRVEGGKLVCHQEAYSLRGMIGQAIALVSPFAVQKGIRLSVHYFGDVPDFILGDEGRFRQVLLNYLNNALKFTERGSIDIDVNVDISVKHPERSKHLVIAVRDTGPGIPEQAQSGLFQPFRQIDNTATRKHGGLGLGLAISARLAEAMGGSVGLQSTLDKGSTFWVRLPLLLANSTAVEPNPFKLDDSPLAELKVLVAEDNAINQKVTLRLLGKLGCSPELAPNGQIAVQMFQQKHYDLVLMDCQMPEVDGYEATRLIRGWEQSNHLDHTPILAVTAHGMAGDRERCLSSGMDDHLVKPLSLEALRNVLERWRTSATVH